MKWHERMSVGTWLLVGAAIIASQALALLAMGQPPICACGDVRFWGGIASGPEISQQLTDWYTYSHVLHGFAFYFALWFVAPRVPVTIRFILALGLEAGWEIFENTPFIIERYRQSALAQGDFGDSISNLFLMIRRPPISTLFPRALPVWG